MSIRTVLAAGTALVLGLLAGCERPPVESVQHGYRGTGMVLVYNPRTVEAQMPNNVPPAVAPAVPQDGPRASQVYQNVKVLGDLSVAELTRTMNAMSQWIAPAEGCAYCHNLQNLADDSKYQKVVARRMLEMTRNVNANWQQHVKQTGVTCWTCHRGQPVPAQVWTRPVPQDHKSNFIGDLAEQNQAATTVGLSSLPFDPFTPYLQEDKPIRVVSQTALPAGSRKSIKQTEFTYGLMMHMSGALGTNCNFCHNSHSFTGWDNAPPQRATAWYGIRMARELNGSYLEGLGSVFPASRKGPTGDVAKVNCATCHQGAYKPVYGAQMAKDFPGLAAPASAAASAVAQAPQ